MSPAPRFQWSPNPPHLGQQLRGQQANRGVVHKAGGRRISRGRQRAHNARSPLPGCLQGCGIVLPSPQALLRLAESSGVGLRLAARVARLPQVRHLAAPVVGCARPGLVTCPSVIPPPALLCALCCGLLATVARAGFSEDRCSWRGRYDPRGQPSGGLQDGIAHPLGLGLECSSPALNPCPPFRVQRTLGLSFPLLRVDAAVWLRVAAAGEGLRWARTQDSRLSPARLSPAA